jgi:hypothetical protein
MSFSSFVLFLFSVTPRLEFFADRALQAMKGLGTDEETLLRVISTRFGVDLADMKRVFVARHGKSLYEWVRSELSGDFKKIMLELIGQGA